MYSMKEACALTDMRYENLKFYCNEGLVPNVKRDSRNFRSTRPTAPQTTRWRPSSMGN